MYRHKIAEAVKKFKKEFGCEPRILVMRYNTFHKLLNEEMGTSSENISITEITTRTMYDGKYMIIRTYDDIDSGEIHAY